MRIKLNQVNCAGFLFILIESGDSDDSDDYSHSGDSGASSTCQHDETLFYNSCIYPSELVLVLVDVKRGGEVKIAGRTILQA